MNRIAKWMMLLASVSIVTSASDSAFGLDAVVQGGQSLIVKFHQPAVPPPDVNVLSFNYGLAFPNSNIVESVISLYDGSTLLGQTTVPALNSGIFATPAASNFLLYSAPIDFTSIWAGTLNGRLVITPTASSGFLHYIAPSLSISLLSSPTNTWQFPIIDEFYAAPTSSVPEPTTAAIAGLALIGMVMHRGRNRSANE